MKTSIICLIYKSTKWLQFVYDQVNKYTDLHNCEFYFIANDASKNVLEYLENNNINHYIFNNTDDHKKEWYINNVYRAYNYGIKKAKGEYVVLINSDMAFTSNWLDNLYNKINDNICVTSRLIERGVLSTGLYGINKNFGDDYNNYNENDLIKYVESISDNSFKNNGLYMPLLIKKEHIEKVGYYPEGNIIPNSNIFNPIYAKLGQACISGDKVLMSKLITIGIHHITSFDSIIYHFQEGEKRE